MLKIQEIREIIKLVDSSSVDEFVFEQDDTKLKLKKHNGQTVVAQAPVAVQAAPVVEAPKAATPAPVVEAPKAPEAPKAEKKKLWQMQIYIKSLLQWLVHSTLLQTQNHLHS